MTALELGILLEMVDTGGETPLASPLTKGGGRGGSSPAATYTHAPLGQQVEAMAGYYMIEAEQRVPFQDREVLVATGHMSIDNACCGAGGCGFALVPGYILHWRSAHNEQGEPLTEVEPVRDEREKDELRQLILESHRVQQVNFW